MRGKYVFVRNGYIVESTGWRPPQRNAEWRAYLRVNCLMMGCIAGNAATKEKGAG